MSKKKKSPKTPQRISRDDDKPDYAMDKMLPVVEKVEKPVPREEQMVLEDRVNRNVVDQLARLKEQMKLDEQKKLAMAAGANARSKGANRMMQNRPTVRTSSSEAERDQNQEPSFAELFDPAPEDEKSFDELMKDSKLDWRAFK